MIAGFSPNQGELILKNRLVQTNSKAILEVTAIVQLIKGGYLGFLYQILTCKIRWHLETLLCNQTIEFIFRNIEQ